MATRGVKPGTKRGKYKPRISTLAKYKPRNKLLREEVEAIYNLHLIGIYTQSEIAKMFNTTQENVSYIVTGARWNSVTGLPKRTSESNVPPPTKRPNGRPRKNFLATLTKAKKKHYKEMEKYCLISLLSGVAHVTIKFPKVFKKPEGFPDLSKKIKEGDYFTVKVSARRLQDWLYNNGHSTYTSLDVLEAIKEINYKTAFANRSLKLDIFEDYMEE